MVARFSSGSRRLRYCATHGAVQRLLAASSTESTRRKAMVPQHVPLALGAIARLHVPPHLGYGGVAAGPVPADAALIFEVELISVA